MNIENLKKVIEQAQKLEHWQMIKEDLENFIKKPQSVSMHDADEEYDTLMRIMYDVCEIDGERRVAKLIEEYAEGNIKKIITNISSL